MPKTINADIDLSNLTSEIARIRDEVKLFLEIRQCLQYSLEQFSEFSAEQVAKMVFDQYDVAESFMHYYSTAHKESIMNDIHEFRAARKTTKRIPRDKPRA
jgi:hypothetical protein